MIAHGTRGELGRKRWFPGGRCLPWAAGLGLGLAFTGGSAHATDPAVKLTRLEDRVRIEIGGTLFSEYRYRGAPKPCLFPILDAEGVSYTRNWPMQKVADEVHDHDW